MIFTSYPRDHILYPVPYLSEVYKSSESSESSRYTGRPRLARARRSKARWNPPNTPARVRSPWNLPLRPNSSHHRHPDLYLVLSLLKPRQIHQLPPPSSPLKHSQLLFSYSGLFHVLPQPVPAATTFSARGVLEYIYIQRPAIRRQEDKGVHVSKIRTPDTD